MSVLRRWKIAESWKILYNVRRVSCYHGSDVRWLRVYRLTRPSFCPLSPDLRRGEKQEMLGFMFLSPGHNHDIITESISPGLSHAMSNIELFKWSAVTNKLHGSPRNIEQSNRISKEKLEAITSDTGIDPPKNIWSFRPIALT